jgi:hypothetical protein
VPCRGRAVGELLTKRISIQVARILDKACAAANTNQGTANPIARCTFVCILLRPFFLWNTSGSDTRPARASIVR